MHDINENHLSSIRTPFNQFHRMINEVENVKMIEKLFKMTA